jgi:predicted DNA-binding transcriptional regulator AlpA
MNLQAVSVSIAPVIPAEGFVSVNQLIGGRGLVPILPISRASLYRAMRAGLFPRPVKIGPKRRVAWSAQVIREALADLAATGQVL